MAVLGLDKAAEQICPRATAANNRRGDFPSFPHGISFGGGQEASIVTKGVNVPTNAQLGAAVSEPLF